MKSLSSKQVCWAQKLSHNYFQIDYCQGKANRAVDAWLHYPQRSAEEEDIFRAKNVKILRRLQSSLARISGFLVDSSQLSPLYQIFICGMTVLPQLC